MKKINNWHILIILVSGICYLPFMNQAFHMDSDMLVYSAHQMLIDPINPPLGEYGKHMVLHDKTNMPATSIYYRSAHGPLLPLFLAPIAAIAGTAEWPFHLFMLLWYGAAVWGGYAFFALFLKHFAKYFSTLVWAVCPALVVNSHGVMWDVPITALSLWIVVFLVLGVRKKSYQYVLVSGILAGLAALTKSSAICVMVASISYLVYIRQWKILLLWLIPSGVFPFAWILHNQLIFGKIQYVSTGLFHPIAGDVRYRVERIASLAGGIITLPIIFWYLAARSGKWISLIVSIFLATIWSVLLVVMLHKSVTYSIAYTLFSGSGIWLCWQTFRVVQSRQLSTIPTVEKLFVLFLIITNALLLLALPSASARYLLPLVPFLIFGLGVLVSSLEIKEQKVFGFIVLSITMALSLGLSRADYLLSDADRRLPGRLIEKGYAPEKTWYFGRLSYDYYLYKSGFRNSMVNINSIGQGSFALNEEYPSDYAVFNYMPSNISKVLIDTLNFSAWPLRTKGGYAGFYGNDRLPYWYDFSKSVRSVLVYAISRSDK